MSLIEFEKLDSHSTIPKVAAADVQRALLFTVQRVDSTHSGGVAIGHASCRSGVVTVVRGEAAFPFLGADVKRCVSKWMVDVPNCSSFHQHRESVGCTELDHLFDSKQ